MLKVLVQKNEDENVSELRAFDRYGEIGEYLKLETKSLMRNKNLRKSFMFATIFVIMLSLVIHLQICTRTISSLYFGLFTYLYCMALFN